jgi:PPOX class probable FMN-dependent enzyme
MDRLHNIFLEPSGGRSLAAATGGIGQSFAASTGRRPCNWRFCPLHRYAKPNQNLCRWKSLKIFEDCARSSVNRLRPTRYKFYDRLNSRMMEFISLSPIAMLATANAAGEPTVSPKGDSPGFAQIEDCSTIPLPERKGNRLIFSLQNVLQNSKVALLFLVPGTNETLRISGDAELIQDEFLCKKLSARGNEAILVTRIKIKECYFHCARAFLRGSLWNPKNWPGTLKISFGEEIAANLHEDRKFVQSLDARIAEDYKKSL